MGPSQVPSTHLARRLVAAVPAATLQWCQLVPPAPWRQFDAWRHSTAHYSPPFISAHPHHYWLSQIKDDLYILRPSTELHESKILKKTYGERSSPIRLRPSAKIPCHLGKLEALAAPCVCLEGLMLSLASNFGACVCSMALGLQYILEVALFTHACRY
jgi:hypothetical protein